MKVGYKIGLMAAGGLVILLFVGAVSYWGASRLAQTDDTVEHTLTVSRELERLFVAVTDAESQSRGYLMSGDANFLEPQHNAVESIKDSIKKLKVLTAYDHDTYSQIENLEGLIDSKVDYAKEYIDLRKSEGFEPAYKLFRLNRGKRLMDQIRVIVRQNQDAETSLFKVQKKDAEDTARRMLLIIGLATILAFALVVSLSFFIIQDITGSIKQLIRAADRIGGGRFEPIRTGNSHDEFADLAMALNEMSHSLRTAFEGTKAERQARENIHKLLEIVRNEVIKLNSKGEDLYSTTKQFAAGFEEQPVAVSRLTSFGSELKQSGEQVNQLCRRVAELCESAEQACQQESQVCHEIQKNIQTLTQKIDQAAKGIASMSGRTEEFVELIASVDKISAGSHFLALSANLEAARESNKGLSILIGELKALAEESRQEGTKARQILLNIQREVHLAVSASQDASSAASETRDSAHPLGERLASLQGHDDFQLPSKLLEASRQHASKMVGLQNELEKLEVSINHTSTFARRTQQRTLELYEVSHSLNELLTGNKQVPPALAFESADEKQTAAFTQNV